MLNEHQKKIVIDIAKQSVENYLCRRQQKNYSIKEDFLLKPAGAFVTLRYQGKLRGCIGRIKNKHEPLWQVISNMAIEAATSDPRFPPVEQKEFPGLTYEVSILSVPRKIKDWREIELGKHGVIIKNGYQGGVFLPQVAEETGWSLEEFLEHLCVDKAGLPRDCYRNNHKTEIFIFSVDIASE